MMPREQQLGARGTTLKAGCAPGLAAWAHVQDHSQQWRDPGMDPSVDAGQAHDSRTVILAKVLNAKPLFSLVNDCAQGQKRECHRHR